MDVRRLLWWVQVESLSLCLSRPEPWAWLLWILSKPCLQEVLQVQGAYPVSIESSRRQGWCTFTQVP